MALFFGAMYIYAWSPVLIAKYKKNKQIKDIFKREKRIKEKKQVLKQNRVEKKKIINDRHEKIKEHFKWLEALNQEIEQREKAKHEHSY